MTKFETIGKSKQLFDFLKNEILSGEYRPGDKFPSIRELASKYGISSITVNSVISNLVTDGLLYVEQGKGTFVAERKLAIRKRKMIGVMFFDFSMENNVEAAIFNSIQKNIKDDYYLIPYNSYNNMELFYKGLKGLMELEVDALILIPPTSEDYDISVVKSILNKDIPIVFINRIIPSIKADFYSLNFEESVYIAAKHMIQKGHRDIAMLTYDSRIITDKMVSGYKKALKEAGIKFKKEHLIEWHKGLDKAQEKLASMLTDINGLIGSDIIIYKLRKVFEESGINIPDALSIIGLNDTVYSRFMNPRLTSIPYPSDKIGASAVKSVVNKLEGKTDEEIQLEFAPEMVLRESS